MPTKITKHNSWIDLKSIDKRIENIDGKMIIKSNMGGELVLLWMFLCNLDIGESKK